MTKKDSEKGIYNVKAISKKIGIQPGTLRAWERRYQIVTPKRNEVGHRIYSEQDLVILKWLVDKVNQGFTISQAVDLLSEKTKESPSLFTTDEILDSKKEEISQNILKALTQFNEVEAESLMEYALSLYRIEVVLFEIIAPLIQISNTGNHTVEKGQIQYVCNWIRMKLFRIYQQIPLKPFLAKVLIIAPQNINDYSSEIRILLYSIFLKLRGFEVYYLGSVDELTLQQLLQKIEPLFVFTLQTKENSSIQNIKKWIEENYPKVKLGVIGQQSNEPTSDIFMGNQMSEWMEWLNQYLRKNQIVMNV
ncbi:MerR family transcriptional regulator [Tepidibacillus fermentans]|uniref:DNA-binding transcriptional MerR regulator n=1 Tax=Tepidibacillus fermentans TaxID=1281767 RepID=A0A4R3KKS5_9BACI|nr:MerR family transcriptional regulator [Tepidibacillus fermentans]TCS84112.1 DNA-binding transcriptional MerR regulator [Tepidibacillus fermentans]